MSMIVETTGFFFGDIGSVMLGITLFNANWRVSSVDGNVITTSTLFENLWMSCATDSTGVYNCRDFPSLLALSGYLQASRALMISALVFGFFSCLSGMVGLQCTKVAEGNSVLKGKFATAAGALSIFAGICAGISVSWYAFNITKDFFNPLYPGTKGYTYNYRAPNTVTSAKPAPQTALPRYESSNSISKYGKNAYV
uniref:Claudin n=1 Tax=Pyxicephalus adspersus TaxID=30357 RepID=A0AAV3B338_PYXAD|nr:TPA: hypothetical protein GDO54_005879 [Pyxicephalus adspersus]